jgi:hypothetical protein
LFLHLFPESPNSLLPVELILVCKTNICISAMCSYLKVLVWQTP